jgi:hypothetical protein
MISHTKRFIFVHIPKTGGTSVTTALRAYGLALQGERNYESIYFKHATAPDLRRMMGDEFYRYFKFAIVRNPWDWAVSNYAFNRGLHRPWTREANLPVSAGVPDWAADWDFKRWLKWWLLNLSPQQSQMVTDSTGRLLVNEILRFENLGAEFLRLCSILGIAPVNLPHAMRTRGRESYFGYYDRETQDWVARHFRDDIERFGYSFRSVSVTNS